MSGALHRRRFIISGGNASRTFMASENFDANVMPGRFNSLDDAQNFLQTGCNVINQNNRLEFVMSGATLSYNGVLDKRYTSLYGKTFQIDAFPSWFNGVNHVTQLLSSNGKTADYTQSDQLYVTIGNSSYNNIAWENKTKYRFYHRISNNNIYLEYWDGSAWQSIANALNVLNIDEIKVKIFSGRYSNVTQTAVVDNILIYDSPLA